MARKKVNLQLITNKVTRRTTYKRRCQSLMKKASELVTLCGAKACVVVYEEGDAVQPEVWLSGAEAVRLFKRFNEMPEGNFKKSTNQLQNLEDRYIKIRDQVKKSEDENCENCERDTSALLHKCIIGRRPGLVGTTEKEVVSLRDLVKARMSKAKAWQQRLGIGQAAHPPLEPYGGELGAVVSSAFAVGCETFNQGSGSGFPWTME